MPRFNKRGFLHCWISFTSAVAPTEKEAGGEGQEEAQGGVGVVLVGGDIDGFERMRSCGKLIMKGLESRNLIKRIAKSKPLQNYSLGMFFFLRIYHLPKRLMQWFANGSGIGNTGFTTFYLQIKDICSSDFPSLRRGLFGGEVSKRVG